MKKFIFGVLVVLSTSLGAYAYGGQEGNLLSKLREEFQNADVPPDLNYLDATQWVCTSAIVGDYELDLMDPKNHNH
jgi:hypothetical protein